MRAQDAEDGPTSAHEDAPDTKWASGPGMHARAAPSLEQQSLGFQGAEPTERQPGLRTTPQTAAMMSRVVANGGVRPRAFDLVAVPSAAIVPAAEGSTATVAGLAAENVELRGELGALKAEHEEMKRELTGLSWRLDALAAGVQEPAPEEAGAEAELDEERPCHDLTDIDADSMSITDTDPDVMEDTERSDDEGSGLGGAGADNCLKLRGRKKAPSVKKPAAYRGSGKLGVASKAKMMTATMAATLEVYPELKRIDDPTCDEMHAPQPGIVHDMPVDKQIEMSEKLEQLLDDAFVKMGKKPWRRCVDSFSVSATDSDLGRKITAIFDEYGYFELCERCALDCRRIAATSPPPPHSLTIQIAASCPV